MSTIAYPSLLLRSGNGPSFTLLSDAGIRLVRMVEPESFVHVVGEHLFGLILVKSVNIDTKTRLRRLLVAVPDAHLVLIPLDGSSTRDLSVMAGQRLVVLSNAADSAALVDALRRAWFEGRVECIRRAARRPALPAVLRCAILRILDERITIRNPEPDEVTLHRTLEGLAERCGVHPDTLRRAGRTCGLDLKSLMRGWTATLALHERFVEGDVPSNGVWRTIARRCGYEGESGLRGLMTRELRARLRELDLGHLHELLDRLESIVARTEFP